MRKKTIAIFLILSAVVMVAGIILFVVGLAGGTSVYDPQTGTNQLTSIGNLPLFITGIVLYVLAFVIFAIGWVGALINLARQQQWTWFVLMILFSVVTLIVYLFAGPQVPRSSRYARPVDVPLEMPPNS